jgi:hypothetical protein
MSRQLIVTLVILACGLVPDRLSGDGPSRLRDSLKSNLFNRVDIERIESGYYQQLLDPGRRLDDLADVPGLRLRGSPGSTWSVPFDDAPLVSRVDDLREVVLKRDDQTTRKGVRWQTNAQGMRDHDYAVDKPRDTFRIALVGNSISAGWGVDVEQRFESILENVWSARAQKARGPKVEIINCAVPAHSPGQRWYHFTQVGWPMNPDLVIYQATAADVGWDERRLRFLLARGIGWDSPIYSAALQRARVEKLGSPDDYKRALRPRHWDILTGVYQAMAADCLARRVPIIWVLLPRIGRPNDGPDQRALIKTARGSGLSRVVDLTDAYDGLDPARLAVDSADFHPNGLAHERLAERLDSALSGLPELRPMWAPLAAPAPDRDPGASRELTTTHPVSHEADLVVPLNSRAGEPR